MCGVIGIVGNHKNADLRQLGLWQNHRGPDEWGEFSDDYVKLGHNRLAILDIEFGKQPMTTVGDEYTLVFNGEIYNYTELKDELVQLGCRFKTQNSDTEVLLLGYKKFGPLIFSKLRGMFAGCIYDKRKGECVLFRDPLGIKPLYYFRGSNYLFFSSELKPLIKSLESPEFNIGALEGYFTNRCCLSDSTFIKDAKRVLPGTYITINCTSLISVTSGYTSKKSSKPIVPYEKKVSRLDKLLQKSVTDHMVSDVPLGVFLSGGVDSSLITHYCSKQGKVKAFSLGTKSKWDETKYAREAAEHLDIDLETKYISDESILNYFEEWAYHNDDPVADPSAMALMVLTEYVRSKNYKVMLAGEGADELFLGYNIYLKYSLFSYLRKVPKFFFKLLRWNVKPLADWKIFKGYMGAGHISSLNERRILLSNVSKLIRKEDIKRNLHREFKEQDYRDRLPNDLLARTDRATMAFSTEARVPFLIDEIVQFSNELNLGDLIELRKGNGKRILKDLALKYLPEELVKRRKTGFEIPIDIWLEEELSEQINNFVQAKNIPGINYDGVKKIITQGNHALVWAWLVLEKWYENWFLGGVKEPIISPYINKNSYDIT
ncbi:asparagine synthase (glutamine-hydrolyzing) [Akkermansiaceae bacterium]|nr:asparagine synthase (glutamine-hydrolyzing) [Akkermansiaceae bacterium]